MRPNVTYRPARRAAWRAIPKAERPSWAEFNAPFTEFTNRRTARRSLEKANADRRKAD